MTSPSDVAAFHAEFDRHPDDRVRLFRAVGERLPGTSRVLYPGSYIDIAPSVWFDDVTYVDVDKRAARFFDQSGAVAALIETKRRSFNPDSKRAPTLRFHHLDYQADLPVGDASVQLLVSLYAGFVSEHCTRYLEVGGTLLVNPSHGGAAMASLDPRYELAGVVRSRDADYHVASDDLDTYLVPKQPTTVTIESLHETQRGIAYTRPAFAYLFTRIA